MTRLILLTLLLAPVLHAATYVVPGDAELIQNSDAIVVATGAGATTERNPRGGIVTRFTLRVDEVLKGDALPGDPLVLTERGGALDGRALVVPGSPRYEAGVRYLVFTSTNRDFDAVTAGMSLGQFRLESGLAVRRDIGGFDRNLEPHVEPLRDAPRFVAYIRDVVAQRASSADYFVGRASARLDGLKPVLRYSRTSYLLETNSIGYRWPDPAADWVRNGTQPGSDGAAAVTNGIAEWNATDSSIDYHDTGVVDAGAVGGLDVDDGRNAVLFNDPNDEIDESEGVVGIGGAFGTEETYPFEGESFFAILEGDVVVAQRSFNQSCLDTIVAHELGHSLGLRHANQPPPGTVCGPTVQCTGDAIMNSSVQCAWNGKLKQWDRDAAATVYGEGVECIEVAIEQQPQSKTVQRGFPFALAVSATGSEPLTYEWFEGERGVTAHPVGFNSPDLNVNDGRAAATKFWVRVSNACSSVDSQAATIAVPLPARRRATRH